MQRRRKARRLALIAKKGGICISCGESDPTLLQFDHQDPRKKEFDLNKIKDGNEDRIHKELKKCVLLCAKCHLEKTKRNNEHVNKDKKPARHGTIWMYIGKKCRCNPCRQAMRAYLQKRLKR